MVHSVLGASGRSPPESPAFADAHARLHLELLQIVHQRASIEGTQDDSAEAFSVVSEAGSPQGLASDLAIWEHLV